MDQFAEAVRLGREADAANSREEALDLYLKAWDAVPEPRREWNGGTWVWNNISQIHFDKHRYHEALEAAKTAELCYRGAENPNTLILLGAIYLDGFGDKENAAKYFKRAWDLSEGRALQGEPKRYLRVLGGREAPQTPEEDEVSVKLDDADSELPEKLHSRIVALCEAGDVSAEKHDFAAALEKYEKALSLLPRPVEKWEAYTWIQAAIGDAYFAQGDWTRAEDAFRSCLLAPGGLENPFVHMRLGQSLYQRAKIDDSIDELMRAYMLGGEEVFSENPLYLELLKKRAVLP